MKRIRAFIALNIPMDTVKLAAELQGELRKVAEEAGLRVSWVPPANLHVTLRFLGEIPEESARAIGDTLQSKLAARPVLPVVVRGVGAFPDPAKPRVLWLGVDSEDDAVVALAGEINTWLDDLGFAPDAREVHPHLTLGRVKQGQADVTSAFAEREIGPCVASEVVLYRSVLQQRGAEYTPLTRVSLAGGPKTNK